MSQNSKVIVPFLTFIVKFFDVFWCFFEVEYFLWLVLFKQKKNNNNNEVICFYFV